MTHNYFSYIYNMNDTTKILIALIGVSALVIFMNKKNGSSSFSEACGCGK